MSYGKTCIGTIAFMAGVPAMLRDFWWSSLQLVAYNAEYLAEAGQYIFYDKAEASFHSMARNSLATNMRGDWLLMIDCDHSFEPDIAARLLHRMNQGDLDVLTAVYQYRQPPHPPVLYCWVDGRYSKIAGFGKKADINRIAAAGAGTLLIRRRVFERIAKELKEPPFDIRGGMGEDFSFFERLRLLGLKAYVDMRVQSHHLKIQPLKLEDFDLKKFPLEKLPSEGWVPDGNRV